MYSWLVFFLLGPSVVNSLSCHRCFGYGFCHDPEHPDFGNGIRVAGCRSWNYWDEPLLSDDPFTRRVEEALNENYRQNFLNDSLQNTELERHCVTARVHETKNSYTLRTCISRVVPTDYSYPSLCEFIENLTESQNWHNGTFSCRQCDNDFCNTHVLQEGDGVIVDDIDDDSADSDECDGGDDSDECDGGDDSDEYLDGSASAITCTTLNILSVFVVAVFPMI